MFRTLISYCDFEDYMASNIGGGERDAWDFDAARAEYESFLAYYSIGSTCLGVVWV